MSANLEFLETEVRESKGSHQPPSPMEDAEKE